MNVRVGLKKAEHWRIDAFELWCWSKTLENPLDCKEIQPVHPKGLQSWIFIGRTDGWSWSSNTLATWCEELTHLKRPWCRERLKAGGEGDDRGWDDWMASPTRWTWVWASSGSWWWTGKPGVLLSMGLQRVRHDWEAELIWVVLCILPMSSMHYMYISFIINGSIIFTLFCTFLHLIYLGLYSILCNDLCEKRI